MGSQGLTEVLSETGIRIDRKVEFIGKNEWTKEIGFDSSVVLSVRLRFATLNFM